MCKATHASRVFCQFQNYLTFGCFFFGSSPAIGVSYYQMGRTEPQTHIVKEQDCACDFSMERGGGTQ